MHVRNPVFLDESAYGRFTAWPENPGWNASTHLAKVNFGHGEEDAYVKLIYNDWYPGLANEAIGWQLAHACNIPAPARAAILVGTGDFWRNVLGTLPSDCPDEGDIAAWCVARCETLDQHTWVSLDEDTAAAALLKSPRGQQIAAFGTWLHHADQHWKNVLRLGDGEWAVIDHELIFNGILGNWRKPHDQRDYSTPPYLLATLYRLTENGRIGHKASSDIRSAMVHHAGRHIDAIARTLPYLADVLEQIEMAQTAKNVLPLIVDRAWNFWMPKAVNKLA